MKAVKEDYFHILKFPHLRIGHTIYVYFVLASTQNKAKELSKSINNNGIVVVAQRQLQGRGRRDAIWISDFGGLYFSVIYQAVKPIEVIGDFTKQLAYVTLRAINNVVKGKFAINLEVRGVNDLYLNNKKLAGIIVETESYGLKDERAPIYIIGVGVNVNQTGFPQGLTKMPTSLFLETNYRFSRLQILKQICKEFSNSLE